MGEVVGLRSSITSLSARLLVSALVLFVPFGMSAYADPDPEEATGIRNVMDLDEAVAFALRHSGLIAAARAGTEALEGKLKQAQWAIWPHIKLKALLAPMPRQWSDPNDYTRGGTDLSEWGVFTHTQVTAVLPIYTFGKISNLKAAARLGVDVGLARETIAREETTFRVRKAFFALSLARELSDVVEEGREYLDKAWRHVKELEDADDPGYDPVDRLKLRVYDAQVLEKELGARRAKSLATAGIRVSIGLDPDNETVFEVGIGDPVEIPDELSEAVLTDRAIESRAELIALHRAVGAREAAVRVKESAFYPNFFLAGKFTYGYSNMAEPQSNPFLYDPYNSYSAGGGIGLEWDLDIGRKLGALRESEGDLAKLRAETEDAERGVRLEVIKLFREMKDHRRMVDAQKDAMEAARGWVIAKSDLYDNDLGELDEVLKGLLQFFQSRMSYLEAVYKFNVSMAHLERAVGAPLGCDDPSTEE